MGCLGRAATWWTATRYHFIAPSFIPAVLGAALAYRDTGHFDPFSFALVLAALVANHVALNMTDDYFDMRHAVDLYGNGEKNPYSGGSGTLTTGKIRPCSMLIVFTVLYAVTALIGIYLVLTHGWPILAFGLFGMACAYFYTAPPVKYGYRGLGELSLLVNFSLTIGLGSYFVQAGSVHFSTVPLLLPLGLLMFSMIVVNEIPDYAADRAGGKMNLVARYGRSVGTLLYVLGFCAAFALLPLSVGAGIATPAWLLPAAALPLAAFAAYIIHTRRSDPVRMAPANLLTVIIHNAVGIGLCAVAGMEGASRHGDAFPAAVMLLALAILYLPVAAFIASGARRILGG